MGYAGRCQESPSGGQYTIRTRIQIDPFLNDCTLRRRITSVTGKGEMAEIQRTDRVVVIGAGFVGSTTAYAIMQAGLTSEVVLIDVNEKRLAGEVMDLEHGVMFVPEVTVRAGDYPDCRDAAVIAITAGANQKPGESRLDLLKRNTGVFRSIVPRIAEQKPAGVVVVVTNPVDILTYVTLSFSGLPPERVIGSGTLLDTARFRSLLSERCGVAAQNVHAYIIGEHGDSEVPAWSAIYMGGMTFERFCRGCDKGCEPYSKPEIFEKVKEAAYRIIEDKGATYYAVALAVRRIAQAIIRDENSVLPVSTLMRGLYGINDVCLSIPCVIDGNGVRRPLEMELSEAEESALRASAGKVRGVIESLDL